MLYYVVASGSKGNATLVICKDTVILIDLGISFKRLDVALKELNITRDKIDAILITHSHIDHISGLRSFSPKIMYSLEGTLASSLTNTIELNKPFKIKDLIITPFKTSHDSINPCGFKLDDGKETLVYMTDTGVFLKENIPLIINPTYLLIESNHDIPMLLKTDRTQELKDRIMSDHGHLCNEDSAYTTLSIIGDKLKEIVLMHISRDANTPEIAYNAYKEIFAFFDKDIKNYSIKIANQYNPISGGSNDEY